MAKSASPRIARMLSIRADKYATQVRGRITSPSPHTELGKSIFINVTPADLPELRALVAFLEAKDDC